MYTKSNQTCHYFKGSSFDDAECVIAENFIKDVTCADIRVCINEYFNTCSLYRRYNEDLIEV